MAELRDQIAKLIKKMPTKESEEKQIAEQKKQQEERRLRSFKVSLDIPREYHQVLIGTGGSTIRNLSTRFDVHISIPNKSLDSDTIIIQGYEEKANSARDEIEKVVEDHKKQQEERKLRSFKTSINIPIEYHQRLIGQGKLIFEFRIVACF